MMLPTQVFFFWGENNELLIELESWRRGVS